MVNFTAFLWSIKVLAIISMIFSTLLMRDIYRKLFRKNNTTTNTAANSSNESWSFITRFKCNISLTQSILLLLGIGDLCGAFFVLFLSTWMVPQEYNVPMSIGNVWTCTMQGFLGNLFFLLSAGSNSSLAVAYCLIVKYGWKDKDSTRYRIPFTLIPIVLATVLSIIPLPGRNYNYNGTFFCDIQPYPLGCGGSTVNDCLKESCDVTKDEDKPCTRGTHARAYLLAVGAVPFMIALTIISCAVAVLIHTVFKQERRMDRFRRGAGATTTNRNLTKQTAYQGIYYVAVCIITEIPWIVYAVYDVKAIDPPTPLALTYMVMLSLQGMLNSSVYFRPRYNAYRANNPTETRLSCLLNVLKISYPCNCWNKELHDTEESDVINTDRHEMIDKTKKGDVDQIIAELPGKA